ncbi:MAG: molybdopterin-binding protein, partial [Chloroflexota bacterium]
MTSARLLSIGSEILLGETVDTNAAHLGGELARLGVVVEGVRALPDDRALIAAAFREARAAVDVVIATGGLGPTHDDVTREGLADALDEALTEDGELADHLRDRWRGMGDFPASNLRQALRIPSATLLDNPVGSAPGWWVDRDASVVVLMPGVPSEMRRMWVEQAAPRLAERFDLAPLLMRTVKCWGLGESRIADLLGDLLASPGAGVDAGIYARDDGVHLRFSTRDAEARATLDECVATAREALGPDVWGLDEERLPEVAMRAVGGTLSSVEHGLHGALAAVLAGTPGYVGGIVAEAAADVSPLRADALLSVRLGDAGAHGRSMVACELRTANGSQTWRLRIHGSG